MQCHRGYPKPHSTVPNQKIWCARLHPRFCAVTSRASLVGLLRENASFRRNPHGFAEQYFCISKSAPDWGRTSNLQLRRLTLYPIELRARTSLKQISKLNLRFATVLTSQLLIKVRAGACASIFFYAKSNFSLT